MPVSLEAGLNLGGGKTLSSLPLRVTGTQFCTTKASVEQRKDKLKAKQTASLQSVDGNLNL